MPLVSPLPAGSGPRPDIDCSLSAEFKRQVYRMQMKKWKAVGVVAEGGPIDIGGANPWMQSWKRAQDAAVDLPHPAYPSQRHSLRVYSIQAGERVVEFAAGEVSANVWAFCAPVEEAGN